MEHGTIDADRLEEMIGPELTRRIVIRESIPFGFSPEGMVGFVGASRTGKDTAALVLDALGYDRAAHGDVLKSRFMQLDRDGFRRLYRWALWAKGLIFRPREAKRLRDAIAFYLNYSVSPFEEGPRKEAIRPALEWYGAMDERGILASVLAEMHRPAYNQRVYNATQCRIWQEFGGILIYLTRPGKAACSGFESKALRAILAAHDLRLIFIDNEADERQLWLHVLCATGHLEPYEAFPGDPVPGNTDAATV